ncbi:EAL domain-containing protein [Bacillus circulans]|uniref:sensor domain-containing protein n=1 Tax=Niallia TaxID=2837506 RepID=UPI0015608321|nr:bifunctional diguanylate cyclase/phosphodiesterase [Niallia circulans]NRG26772.1 EAL domain-containing protein [Niallia circulans]
MDKYNENSTSKKIIAQSKSNIENIIFEIIFMYIKDMVFIMKVEKGEIFRYIFVNEAAFLFAKLPINFIGKKIQDVNSAYISARLQKEYSTVCKRKENHSYTDQIKLNDGELIYAESVLTPIKDDKDEVKYIVSITRDITESIKEKLLLYESEQRYRSLVENNLDAVLTVNLDGVIQEVNPAGLKLIGFSDEAKTIFSLYDLIDEENTLFYGSFKKCKLTKTSQSVDCKLISKNGNELSVHSKFVPIIVNHTIKGIYVILRDISEKKKTAEKIQFMSFHDQLTGLYNRRALMEAINLEIKRAETDQAAFALMTIDLDRFKYINDTFGHIVGDQILVKVAERLLEFNNYKCHVYRQGGDEFNILLSQTNRQEVASIAQQILSTFANSFYLDSQEYYISPSIGISMYPQDGEDIEILIKNADEALFRVKERGKAHYQFYRSDMTTALTNIVSVETKLRKAVQRNELKLYFQPQIDLNNYTFNSFEALLRWESPSLGLVAPNDFIPLAEDTGLIISIGNWVIETACEQIKIWKSLYNLDVRIAVNISPKQFQQPNFVEVIREAIKKYNIQPFLLEVEITEGVMENIKEAVPILRNLKELGVIISVDDFGTGYSSLSYIKQFPIDVLKIDQSFIKDAVTNAKDAAITTTIIHLGQNLGMEVIAEGVENKDQEDFLKKANCQKAQGYYYSKPLTCEDAEQFLRQF